VASPPLEEAATPLYRMPSVALNFLLISISHALGPHSFTRKKFSNPARIALRVPAPAPQMRVPATRAG